MTVFTTMCFLCHIQYLIPALEAEAAAKSRAMQWFLRRGVWKAFLPQLDGLHELWPHHCLDASTRQCYCPLEVHHRTCQQCQGQRNPSRVVSVIPWDNEKWAVIRFWNRKEENQRPTLLNNIYCAACSHFGVKALEYYSANLPHPWTQTNE